MFFGMIAVSLLLSDRILRSKMLSIRLSAKVNEIEKVVAARYQKAGFAKPLMAKRSDRVDVSLLSQRAGNCSEDVCRIQNGVVVAGS